MMRYSIFFCFFVIAFLLSCIRTAVPPAVGEGLLSRQHGIEGARWRPLDALHVTLAFYGEASERTADDLASELSRAEGGGAFGVLVHVHLDDLDLVAIFGGQFFQRRTDLAAGATPFGPEIDHNRGGGLADFAVKCSVGNGLRGHEILLRCAGSCRPAYR